MKKLLVSLASIAMICSTVGCANGPVRNFLRNAICDRGCEGPQVDPSYGFGFDGVSGDCANGNCAQPMGGGQLLGNAPSINGSLPTNTSYMNDSFSQGDPYISGSNYGGATINPPVFDSYSGPTYGSTIVPPANSGSLPVPTGR